jgi:hypothetical protein
MALRDAIFFLQVALYSIRICLNGAIYGARNLPYSHEVLTDYGPRLY